MPLKKLREFLDAEQVKYVLITHSPAFTASEIAAAGIIVLLGVLLVMNSVAFWIRHRSGKGNA